MRRKVKSKREGVQVKLTYTLDYDGHEYLCGEELPMWREGFHWADNFFGRLCSRDENAEYMGEQYEYDPGYEGDVVSRRARGYCEALKMKARVKDGLRKGETKHFRPTCWKAQRRYQAHGRVVGDTLEMDYEQIGDWIMQDFERDLDEMARDIRVARLMLGLA